jgi:hypothetical protein
LYTTLGSLYRPSDRSLLAKLVPTLADRGCRVVSATDPHGRNLGFLVVRLRTKTTELPWDRSGALCVKSVESVSEYLFLLRPLKSQVTSRYEVLTPNEVESNNGLRFIL